MSTTRPPWADDPCDLTPISDGSFSFCCGLKHGHAGTCLARCSERWPKGWGPNSGKRCTLERAHDEGHSVGLLLGPWAEHERDNKGTGGRIRRPYEAEGSLYEAWVAADAATDPSHHGRGRKAEAVSVPNDAWERMIVDEPAKVELIKARVLAERAEEKAK